MGRIVKTIKKYTNFFVVDHRHQGWLAGANLSFNPQQGKFNKTNFAIGYQDKDFQVHTNV